MLEAIPASPAAMRLMLIRLIVDNGEVGDVRGWFSLGQVTWRRARVFDLSKADGLERENRDLNRSSSSRCTLFFALSVFM